MNWKFEERKRKQTMKAFNQLPSNVISWESFKRRKKLEKLVKRGAELAMRIIKKEETQK